MAPPRICVGRPGLRRHRHFDVGKKAERQRCGGSPPGPVRGRRCFKGRRLHRLLGEGRSCGDTGAATRTPSASKITDPLVFRQWLIVPEGSVAQEEMAIFVPGEIPSSVSSAERIDRQQQDGGASPRPSSRWTLLPRALSFMDVRGGKNAGFPLRHEEFLGFPP